MADDAFDPRRETLVMETKTTWGPDCGELSDSEKSRLSRLLHENAEQAAQVRYTRSHTGFIREITVTPADLERLAAASSA
jgi:hypothetical protein